MNSTVKNKEKFLNLKKIKEKINRYNVLYLSFLLVLFSFNLSFASDVAINISSDSNNPTEIALNTSINRKYLCYGSDNSVYCVCVQDNSGTVFYFASSNLVSTSYSYGLSTNGSSPYWIGQSTGNNYSDTYGFYYTTSSVSGYDTFYVPVVSSEDEALSLLSSFGVTESTVKYPYTFQNGYLFVYDLGSYGTMYSFDLSSKSEEYSNVGSNPFPNTNQSYWFSDTLPEIDVSTIPPTSAAIILWQKGDNANIFGQTQNMVANINGTSGGRYLYIYNPPAHYKWSGNTNPTSSEVVNYPLTILGISSGDTFYIYDSIARLYDFNQGGKIEGTITGETGYGFVSSEGAISVTTSEGSIYNQTAGGSTDISGAYGGSIAENINGLKQTLDEFVNEFILLLSAPISHIQQLISTGHNFIDVFSQFFSWLPSEVVSVIVSAMIILVVVGVLKLLL